MEKIGILKKGLEYIIETERLGLRRLTKDDSDALYTILSDPEVMKYYPAPYNLDGVKNWIGRSMESYHNHAFGLWGVILKESGSFIGQCGITLQHIDDLYVPEIGYHINKSYWNQGYATEAAKASLQYGFQHLNLKSIFIHTYVKNIPSQRIAQKIGMKKIKEYDKYLHSHAMVWRHVVYSMTKNASTWA